MTDMSFGTVGAPAQTQAPNKRQDDYNMAKLQKSLKQEQRRSKHRVAKLTPAEIRSLNHGVSLSKASSLRSLDNHSIRRTTTDTPPPTPDYTSPIHRPNDNVQRRRSSAELPTPPISPDRERRASTASGRVIHSPKPLSHAHTVVAAKAGPHSRPSSGASYRGVATYRGPEITRTGSMTMLQRPSQQIVSNPLSQFSRPRQSTIATSSQKSLGEPRSPEDMASPVVQRSKNQSMDAGNHAVSRDYSPVRPCDSPVSMEDGKVPDKSTNGNDPSATEDVPVVHLTPKMAPGTDKKGLSEPAPKQKLNWRKTFAGSSDQETSPLKKEQRRRTLMAPKQGYCLHTIRYDDTKPGAPPQLRDSLKDELPSSRTSVFKDDDAKKAQAETEYGQHPAVRPLSVDLDRVGTAISDSLPPSNSRGKQRETESDRDNESDSASMNSSVPSYMRCSCCGRVQKPGGFESELSPVFENENLRTNFNFEVWKVDGSRQTRSSSISSEQRKYVPIVPMELNNEIKQARIEPLKDSDSAAVEPQSQLTGVAVNKLGDVIGPSSTPLAIMPRTRAHPKFTRFASLHIRNEEKKEDETPKVEPAHILAPAHQLTRFGSLHGIRTESQEQAPQQNSYPVQQESQPQPQSAHQAQQSRQYPHSNEHRPLRSSRLAYQEDASPTVPTPVDQPKRQSVFSTVTTTPPSQPVQQSLESSTSGYFEKPLGDSPASTPVSHGKDDDTSSAEGYSPVDEQGVVDLSSFDGSFMQNSLVRSNTVINSMIYSLSHGIPMAASQNGTNSNAGTNGNASAQHNPYTTPNLGEEPNHTPAQPVRRPQVSHINTYTTAHESLPNSPSNHRTKQTRFASPVGSPTGAEAPLSAPPVMNPDYRSRPTSSSSAYFDPRSMSSSMTSTPQPIDMRPASATATTITRTPNTTIVKLIPSEEVSRSSSLTSANGPLRLEDWTLSESPRAAGSQASSQYSSGENIVTKNIGVAA